METYKTYAEQVLIRTCDCDGSAYWRPSAMMELMQEIAGMQCERLGIGRTQLVSRGLAWVISRLEVKMDRWPRIGERITVETFPRPAHHGLFPRYYRVMDESGAVIGAAGSLWVLLDLETRRMTAAPDILAKLPDNSDMKPPLDMPPAVMPLEGTPSVELRSAVYTDLDANGHVNNTRYIDWCCNALGIDRMQACGFGSYAVNYNREILPGQTIETRLVIDGNNVSYIGSHEGERCFAVSGTLAPRA